MKKYFATVLMYLAMAWYFFCTAIFMLVASPANAVFKKMSVVGNSAATQLHDPFVN